MSAEIISECKYSFRYQRSDSSVEVTKKKSADNHKGKLTWSEFFSSPSTPHSREHTIEAEISLYVATPPLPDKSIDPLHWWQQNNSVYPNLSHLARRYLCIQGTSVASERVFSHAGYIVNDRRCSLKPDLVNKLVFLNRNL